MKPRLSDRLLSLFTAVLVLAACLPLSALASSGEFVSENLMRNEQALVSLTSIAKYASAEAYFEQGNFKTAQVPSTFDIINDGDTETLHDAYYGWDGNNIHTGVLIELDREYSIGNMKLFSGTPDYSDTYAVYAGTSLSDLMTSGKLVKENIVCTGTERSVEINRKAKYVALILTGITLSNARIAEVELWTAEESSDSGEFVTQNAFRTMLEGAQGVNMFVSNGAVESSTRFDEKGALAASTDGNITSATDVYGALDWVPARYIGALYTLTDAVYASHIMIYSGLDAYQDTYRVYASDTLADLYSDANLIADDVVCGDAGVRIDLDLSVKYVAFFCTDYNICQRVREFELWTGDDTGVFVSENLLRTNVASSALYHMSAANGSVSQGTKFDQNGALAAATDGVTGANKPVYDCINGWEYPVYPGVRYIFNDAFFADRLTVYATGTVLAYASTSLDDLYSPSNCIADHKSVSLGGTEIPVGKRVLYLAVFCVGFSDVAEFELWSGEDRDSGELKGESRVLTIGNSFAENASQYASEIAAAQGYGLTFGYLKYPSCTIEQHYNNALADNAVYKFAYTSYDGSSVSSVTVKNGQTEFASIKEALTYADWDIVVLQQASTASYTYASYEKTADLIAYIKSLVPDCEIMLHETWSWATWATDAVPENNFKYIEDCYHQLSSDLGGLTIIPTGRAFEFARQSGIFVNDSDNQHANAYGKYLAGACYAAEIFGLNLYQNTFGNAHPNFADVDMELLRAAVSKAVNFRYDPDTNWDYIPETDNSGSDPNAVNFIKRHYKSNTQILQDISNHTDIYEDGRFSAANGKADQLAIDGDTAATFEVWGALGYEYPKNIGIIYELDASYQIESAVIYAGNETNLVTFDVYAAETMASVFEESNLVASGVACQGGKASVAVNKLASYVAFVITGYQNSGDSAHIAEFDLTGSDEAIVIEPITWPAVPDGVNLLKNASASEIIAPGGDFKSSKEYDYRFMDYKTETDLSKLTDGNLETHYDIWSLTEYDKPGVLYDLGAYYDLSHVHAWAGVINSQIYTVNGYRIYASDSLEDLYKDKNLIFSYENERDTTNEAGADVSVKKVRYIAFLLTNQNGGWKLREFAAFGTLSADQSAPAVRTSIIEGVDAEYYGIASDNLADPVYNGASDNVSALTDGSRELIEFWGGADVENTCFVFIYNLYANYDLTGLDVYTYADVIDSEFGLHKGVKSAKVYASRTFADLFGTTPIVLKDGYASATEPDEESLYSADARSDWKAARYVAFVFTIGDTKYGACRLEELKVYGTLSTVQDEEEQEARLPQYIDIEAANGVIARIFALGGNDDLSKLDAHLNADRLTSGEQLEFVSSSLGEYSAEALYSLEIVNSTGGSVDSGGRLIRLSFPKEAEDYRIACVDDFGAEIISNGTLNNYLTVETETLRSYALVRQSEGASSSFAFTNPLFILVVGLGVLAGCGIAADIVLWQKLRRRTKQ